MLKPAFCPLTAFLSMKFDYQRDLTGLLFFARKPGLPAFLSFKY